MIYRALIIILFFTACHREEIDSLKQEIHELRSEVRELAQIKYDIEKIKNLPVQSASSSSNTTPENSAVIEKKFKSSSNELDDPFFGKKDAQAVMMMFTDHQCKLCVNFLNNNLEKIKNDYTKKNTLKFILRDHPLSTNTNAFSAANFTNCAGEQGKYWEALNLIATKQDLVEKSKYKELANAIKGANSNKILRCLNRARYNDEIEKDKIEADNLGLTGVPSFFVGKYKDGEYDGHLIRGAQPFNFIKTYLDKVVKSE